MALEDIFRALEEQAHKERDDILGAARAQAEAIEADAADQAAQKCAACVESAEVALERRRAREVNAARLEHKKRVARVKEEAIEDVFEQAMARLRESRAGAGYPGMFRALATEALDGMTEDVAVLVDPADEELARRALDELGTSAEVRGELATGGGLVAITGGGRVMRRNTLEDRLDKVTPDLQAEIARTLFS